MSQWDTVQFEQLLVDNKISYGVVQPGAFQTNAGTPLIRVNNIKNGKIDVSGIVRIHDDIAQKHSKTRLNGGELLITVVGAVGECAIVPKNLSGYNVARAVSVAKIKDIFDKRFIAYQFKTEDIKFQMYGNTNDTVQPTLNLSELKKLIFRLPKLSEQKAIASVLSALDDKIDLLDRQNRTLESMAETLFRHFFIEEAKETWTSGTIKDEFDFVMGQSPSGSSFNEEGKGMPMYQGNADFGFRFPSNRVFTTEPTRFAEPLDTLISVRAPVGAQNMALEKCCIGRGLSAFRFKTNHKFYTYTYFKLHQLMNEIKHFNDEGTVFGSISKSDFEKIEITIPPYDKISSFEDIAKPVNDKVIKNCHQIAKLEKIRDTLLPKLMSGEVRVQYAEEAIASVA
ncbi:restriction endonuclease subunit S [Pantoea stewartii]|uniref:restriction endonuclease subunit S n=1 Tax=Pantoea stewartii TaxID=66269 RepID=UPI00345C3844